MTPRGELLASVIVGGLWLMPRPAHAVWPEREGATARGDFDGNGASEIVVSSPESDCGKGSVYVVDPVAGSSAEWTRDSTGILGIATCNDDFGAAVVTGDFNGDGRDDLAVGAPDADDAGANDAGVVHVIYGSATGLTASGDQIWHQDSTGIAGTAETDDDFGSVLAVGDFDCDGIDDLAIGVPMEELQSKAEVGAVHVLYGGSGGLSNVDDYYRQGVGGANGIGEAGDHFGAALVSGNFNGDEASSIECADLVIGIPDEEVQGTVAAGKVYMLLGGIGGLSTTGDESFSQEKTGIGDSAQTDDRFGARLLAGDEDGDGYDELGVVVPGDACHVGHGVGQHVIFGGSGGLSTTGDRLDCEAYRCVIDDAEGTYACHSFSPPVHASTGADTIQMFVGDDVVHGRGGADTIAADAGDDVIFGGAGADQIDGGTGLDVLIGGAGDDVFVVDRDCEVLDGEVIDGGPGSDTIESHLTRTQLEALGLEIYSVEAFTLVGEENATCEPIPFEEGPFARPLVALTWDDLPDRDSVFTSTGSTLDLELENLANEPVVVELRFTIAMQGYAAEVDATPFTLTSLQTTTHVFDLEDLIPAGVNMQNIDTALFDLPTSAILSTRAELTVDGDHAGYAFAPRLYGHLEDDGATMVVYRIDAYHDTYESGDLMGWRANRSSAGGPGRVLGRIEARVEPPSP